MTYPFSNNTNDCVYQTTGSIKEFTAGGHSKCELTRLTFPLIDRSVDQIFGAAEGCFCGCCRLVKSVKDHIAQVHITGVLFIVACVNTVHGKLEILIFFKYISLQKHAVYVSLKYYFVRSVF